MHFSKFVLAIASSSLLVGSALATNGGVTLFQPGLGACGFSNSDNDFVAAVNSVDWANGAACGRSIQVTYEGISVTVVVVDLCPPSLCGAEGVAVSPAAFEQLAPLTVGHISAEWNFV